MKNTFDADDKIIPIHVPANVIRWLDREGYGRAELVLGSGIDKQDIDSPETLITLVQHYQLIQNILRITNNPHIGLAYAKQVRYTNMGSVGWALASSATLLESLQTCLKYLKLRSPLIQMKCMKTRVMCILPIPIIWMPQPFASFTMKLYLVACLFF